MSEILYPRSTIRHRLKEVLSGTEPSNVDAVIEHIDIKRAYYQLPYQYKKVFRTLLDSEEDDETDWEMMVMELGEDKFWIEQTLAAAWDHLYSLLNPERKN